jgi:DNA polymerase type B, organellar and viral
MAVKFENLADQELINSFNYKSSKRSKDRPTLLDVPIVAIDGEGYNSPDGDHHYDLIAAAGNEWEEHLSSETELTPENIFEFLLSLPEKHGKALFFIYGGSYDFNMWVKRMGDRALKRLATTGRTKWKHYRITWKPKREIFIQDVLSVTCNIVHKGKNKGRHTHKYKRFIHIYDVIGFFQMSFVAALTDWKTTDQETIDRIASMKKQRGDFSEVEKTKILDYCLEECRLLVKLGEDFRKACNRADIKPHHWYGAGALASTLMRAYGVKNYITEAPEVKLYQVHAYFGGRTEISYQGRMPNGGYQYDINSAYPTAIVDLPCLIHGKWEFHTNSIDNFHKHKWGMWRVKWNTHGKLWNPFPWRSQDGRIFYPDCGEGIYHTVEINSAIELFNDCVITVYEGWTWTPYCKHRPFSFVPEKAEYRLKLKTEQEPAAKPLKLGLNSLYGKMAQTLGKNPPYQNFFWAGYITAATRAKLLDAIRYCSGTVYSVATDGLIASVEIDQLIVGTSLGTWEKTKIIQGFLVKPGVYKWLDDKAKWHYGTRGFTTEEAKWEELEEMWDRKQFMRNWEFPANRFIGLIQAFHRGEGWREWFAKWIEAPRRVSFHPTVMTREWSIGMDKIPYDQMHKAPSFLKLKYTCRCKHNLPLSSVYKKAEQDGLKEFINFLIDDDQP